MPSGRLGWLDLENAAPTPWGPLARLLPGTYLLRLVGEENPEYWGLVGPEQYPFSDEDWVLHAHLLEPLTPIFSG